MNRPPPRPVGPRLSREERNARESPEDTGAKEGASASAQQDTTDGGVRRDGKPGPSAKRYPKRTEAEKSRRKMPSRVRERSISAKDSDPGSGPEREPPIKDHERGPS